METFLHGEMVAGLRESGRVPGRATTAAVMRLREVSDVFGNFLLHTSCLRTLFLAVPSRGRRKPDLARVTVAPQGEHDPLDGRTIGNGFPHQSKKTGEEERREKSGGDLTGCETVENIEKR